MKMKYQKLPVPVDFKVIVDRFSLYDNFVRAMVKILSTDGVYILNNPFANTCDDKALEFNLCSKLKIPYPKTFILPQENTNQDVSDRVELPNLDEISSQVQFPMMLKPYNGYAWTDVIKIHDAEELKKVYEDLRKMNVFLLQEFIHHKVMYRVYCFGQKETLFIKYDPTNRKYLVDDYSAIQWIKPKIEEYTIKLCKALDYDFNAVEWMIDENDNFYAIDAFNETPELLPEAIPKIYYDQILQKFTAVIEQKYSSNAKNKLPFNYMPM
jgi:glutathione synthase/RimK-type ligase-like ATP-grasp enzyme